MLLFTVQTVQKYKELARNALILYSQIIFLSC